MSAGRRGSGPGRPAGTRRPDAIAATLLAVRALWVFPLSLAVPARRGTRPSRRVPAVVSWAGARGVLPLAAALSIPLVPRHGAALPGRHIRGRGWVRRAARDARHSRH